MTIKIKDITRDLALELMEKYIGENGYIYGSNGETNLVIERVSAIITTQDYKLTIVLHSRDTIEINYADYSRIEIM